MNSKKIKSQIEQAIEDCKAEFKSNEFLRRVKPLWVVIGGIALLAWVLSGAPVMIASVSASFIILLVLGCLLFGPPLWVFTDARNRHLKRPLAWGIFALLTTPIGALIYFLIRPDQSKLASCHGCEAVVSSKFQACPYCGIELVAKRNECPSCDNEVMPDWRFCPYCRTKLDPLAASPPETSAAKSEIA